MQFKTFKAKDEEVNLVQANIQSLSSYLNQNLFNQALLIENVNLVGGDNKLNHKLGRELKGYIIVLKNNNAVIYDTQSTNTLKQLFLVLNTDKDTTVSLIVF
jgi:hypothetical protein